MIVKTRSECRPSLLRLRRAPMACLAWFLYNCAGSWLIFTAIRKQHTHDSSSSNTPLYFT